MATVQFQMPLPCEACAFRIKGRLLNHFEGSVESVVTRSNSEGHLGEVIVRFNSAALTRQEISDYIYNDLLNPRDRSNFRMLDSVSV